MNKKNLVMSALIALAVLVVAFVPISSQQGIHEYDPWSDINGDGKMDGKDIAFTAAGFGTLGDPTRNVTVTNWPVQRETFAKNLLLRATRVTFSPRYRLLIDHDTPYVNANKELAWGSRYDYENIGEWLNTTDVVIYKQVFIYEKVPTKSYQILGMPLVSLTWNVTNTPSADYSIAIHVRLGVVSDTGTWTQLVDLGGSTVHVFDGIYTNYQDYQSWATQILNPITVNAGQRLAVQIEIHGFTQSGTTWLALNLLFGMNTDEFVVSIPIVES